MSEHELESKNFDPDFEPVVNHSGNTSFADVLASRMQRRTVMKGTMGAALAGIMGVGLAGCGSDSDSSSADTDLKPAPGGDVGGNVDQPEINTALGFQAVPVSGANTVVVPEGYKAEAFLPWGQPILRDPVTGELPAYKPDGTNTGAEQELQVGMHRSEEHTSELQSRPHLVCRLLLEKKKNKH